MKKCLLFLVSFIAIMTESGAQFSRYLVKLKNKGGSSFTLSNPGAYLSQRAIDRRTRYGIALDSTDLPVTPAYVTQIRNVPNVTVLNVSKWLNTISIQTTDPNAITTISSFSFVQSVSGIAARQPEPGGSNKFAPEESVTPLSGRPGQIDGDFFNYGTNSYNEIHLHNGEFLHNVGLRGQGMQIAMLDNGFNNYTAPTNDALDSINVNNQVLGTWDFVARESNVANDGSHGLMCFSTIAANLPGIFVGKAPKANFWLYQTEDNASEYPIEELNWSCGAERADSSGADIISTSLGYTTFDNTSLNHTYADMNGNTTMAAIAADLAAKKGLLVFASAGNDGGSAWHFLSTPSDGDSVICVGAVSSTGTVGGFSSYGPSSDGQVKPDMASVGVSAIVQYNGFIGTNNGTSFACPNMAGLATCLWQGFPEFNNMKIRQALWRAGSKYTGPDDRVGYGIPNMKKAFAGLLVDFATAAGSVIGCDAVLNWTSKDVSAMKYEIERKTITDTGYIKIGELNPQSGTILANHNYQFSHTLVGVPAGTVLYRIRQIIDTAAAGFTAVYLDTVSVTSAGCVATFIKVSPNPSSGNTAILVVQMPDAIIDMPIRIFDMKGRLMMQLQRSKLQGKATFDIAVDRFAKGKYIIRVYNKNQAIGTAEFLRL